MFHFIQTKVAGTGSIFIGYPISIPTIPLFIGISLQSHFKKKKSQLQQHPPNHSIVLSLPKDPICKKQNFITPKLNQTQILNWVLL